MPLQPSNKCNGYHLITHLPLPKFFNERNILWYELHSYAASEDVYGLNIVLYSSKCKFLEIHIDISK